MGRSAEGFAREAAHFYSGDRHAFVDWVGAAAAYHDLGKVDEANQAILRRESRKGLPIAHEDAGVAALDHLRRYESVVLAAAHHLGLFSRSDEFRPEKADCGRVFRRPHVADHVDQHLGKYLQRHQGSGCPSFEKVDPKPLHGCGFARRVALSCLVDADHGNTAEHYGEEPVSDPLEGRWKERLQALDRYVAGLPEGRTDNERERNALRRKVYEACRDALLTPALQACDSPVGSGKTTAVMAHLLRVAAARGLRHVFVVLPYTNIITQAVEVYRKALVLEGEKAEKIVAEHHHRAEFEEPGLRRYAALWRAPIIVTTAVQFFETLGSHRPAALRKLHELPGSAVFVDEMHAAIPAHLWPQMWRWLETWTGEWGGHLVLASGSLARFWNLDEYREAIAGEAGTELGHVPDLIADDELKEQLRQTEGRRIRYCRRPEDAAALDCEGLVGFVQERKGPRLLIVNTVQTAAVVAKNMRERGNDVLHLSTALAPAHRDLIVSRIKQRLREGVADWTLVATSCVEAGMDFSFRSGFRERASTASLIQVGGRVSRGAEHEDAEVWDLLLLDEQFRKNPGLQDARKALDRFRDEELNRLAPDELATTAMRREWTAGADKRARELLHFEETMEYPTVSERCRVIIADTVTVVIDPGLAEALRNHKKVSRLELLRYSVQVWATKVQDLALEKVGHSEELYEWKQAYDPDFLGYMAGVLRLQKFASDPEALIL
ncbi:MAG: CRISPR-associated helicase/endonuclease Cas3 [Deferrisomatales bacterium]